jgi:heptosyltransferase-2
VTVPQRARDAGRALLVESGWNGRTPLVALAPGAAYGGAKRWPPQYFAELADGLAADGVQCVMVGTAADAATASGLSKFVARLALLNLVGRTDLPTLAGVFATCRALVTNDSGAMHLAAAVGIAVTAMFGPTNEQETSPRIAQAPPSPPLTILTHAIWCRPCMLRECPLDHRCLRGIEVAAVLEAARSSL